MPVFKEIRRGISRAVRRAFDLVTGAGRPQQLNTEEEAEGAYYRSEELTRLLRQAAADSCVLLKNDGALPLEKEEPVYVLGRCQCDWFFVGYGSGGDVHAPYKVNLLEGLRNAGANLYEPLAKRYEALCASREHRAEEGYWGHWPLSHPEFVNEIAGEWERAGFHTGAESRGACIVVIGRASGEDSDVLPEKGGWYLTDAERRILDMAAERFRRVIVILNVGCVMDLSWVKEYGSKLSAVLIAWLGGQESGNAVCDVLYGDVCPSGRLPMTAAYLPGYPADFGAKERTEYSEGLYIGYRRFEKFAKEKVIFPFGHGLSYTSFALSPGGITQDSGGWTLPVTVKNIGSRSGARSVLVFVRPPEGLIDKPIRTLCAFGKTGVLAPGEEEELILRFGEKALASFDAAEHAFVLEAGDYYFIEDGRRIGRIYLPERKTVERVRPIFLSGDAFRERVLDGLRDVPSPAPVKGARFSELVSGRITAEELAASLSVEELEALTRGHGMMNSPLGPKGNAGVLGGVTEALRKRGVPAASCCDGPAGLRMGAYAALIPCGTALASTFDTGLVEALHRELGREMRFLKADIRLAPGMNLIRHPLCGRNFEYFSEDPLLSGLIAAAEVRGIQAEGAAACPKHFACNNQEAWRTVNDSVVSERASRELYLRNFEICVKEAKPLFVMTSYNKVNGVWAHYHYDLVEEVLRREWGFEGAVMTDWWMRKARSPEFPLLRDNAYRVRAGVDVLMPGDMGHVARHYKSDGTLTESLGEPGGVTRRELERSAARVLSVLAELENRRK